MLKVGSRAFKSTGIGADVEVADDSLTSASKVQHVFEVSPSSLYGTTCGYGILPASGSFNQLG